MKLQTILSLLGSIQPHQTDRPRSVTHAPLSITHAPLRPPRSRVAWIHFGVMVIGIPCLVFTGLVEASWGQTRTIERAREAVDTINRAREAAEQEEVLREDREPEVEEAATEAESSTSGTGSSPSSGTGSSQSSGTGSTQSSGTGSSGSEGSSGAIDQTAPATGTGSTPNSAPAAPPQASGSRSPATPEEPIEISAEMIAEWHIRHNVCPGHWTPEEFTELFPLIDRNRVQEICGS